MRFIAFLIIILALTGCETTKCFLGISTKDIEQSRSNAVSKVVNYDYTNCVIKTKAAIKSIGGYIYSRKYDMIACYNSAKDTTPVGVYFKKIDDNNTQVEVASPSSYVKEQFAQRLFDKLGEESIQE